MKIKQYYYWTIFQIIKGVWKFFAFFEHPLRTKTWEISRKYIDEKHYKKWKK